MNYMIDLIAKIILFFRKVHNKIVSIYQLSHIPHGVGCEIRGGDSSFLGGVLPLETMLQ